MVASTRRNWGLSPYWPGVRTSDTTRQRPSADYDAVLARCPSRQLLDRISDKWVTLILAALGSDRVDEPRAMRYSELARRLAGVNPDAALPRA